MKDLVNQKPVKQQVSKQCVRVCVVALEREKGSTLERRRETEREGESDNAMTKDLSREKEDQNVNTCSRSPEQSSRLQRKQQRQQHQLETMSEGEIKRRERKESQ